MSRDDGIDQHLRMALQHAPDRDLAPPATLDQSVLAAAHQSVQAAAAGRATVTQGATALSAPPRRRWQRWLAGLLWPRALATLATVVLASVLAGLWNAGQAPEQEPPPEAVATPERTRTPEPAPAPGSVTAALPNARVANAPNQGTARLLEPLAMSRRRLAPPIMDLRLAAAGPWEHVPADQMPAGGMLVHDDTGQTVLGRVVIDGEILWWQPWVAGQAETPVLRAPAHAEWAKILLRRWPAHAASSPGRVAMARPWPMTGHKPLISPVGSDVRTAVWQHPGHDRTPPSPRPPPARCITR